MSDQGVIDCRFCNGELEINGISMHTPAWCVTDCIELWLPNAVRGQNVIIPGASGRRAYQMRRDESNYSLPMVITGYVDDLGDRYPDPWDGLQANIAFLYANIVDAAIAATLPATLTMPDLSVRTANVQVRGLNLGNNPAPLRRATLELVVPSGLFS